MNIHGPYVGGISLQERLSGHRHRRSVGDFVLTAGTLADRVVAEGLAPARAWEAGNRTHGIEEHNPRTRACVGGGVPQMRDPGALGSAQDRARGRRAPTALHFNHATDGRTMITGYRVAIRRVDERKCWQYAGARRFVYNWANATWRARHAAGEKSSAYTLNKLHVVHKDTDATWLNGVPSQLRQYAIADLAKAMRAARGWPSFQSRHKDRPRFRILGTFKVEGDRVTGTGFQDGFQLWESDYVPEGATIKQAQFSWRAGRWYVSFLVDDGKPEPKTEERNEEGHTIYHRGWFGRVVGCDFGITDLVTFDDGTSTGNARSLESWQKADEKVALWNRRMAKKQKGSANRKKARLKLQRAYARRSNVLNDLLHNISHDVVSRGDVIVIEDLNVKGMMQNRCLSRALGGTGLYELRRQIEYKAKREGRTLIIADRWYPSSQLCSDCGAKQKVALSTRTYKCGNCGLVIGRDHNAALNLTKLAIRLGYGVAFTPDDAGQLSMFAA